MNDEYDALLREVHIYTFLLSQVDTAQLSKLQMLLDVAELERLYRFRSEELQQDFLLAHGMLRILLGQYVAVDPAALRFVTSPFGKPALAMPAGSDIQFNLAHSAGCVLIAITRGRQLGVDIENIDAQIADTSFYVEHFTASEQQALANLPPALALRGFYTAWTSKEAFIKATGEGFSADLQSFSVTIDLGKSSQPTMIHDGDKVWYLHQLDISSAVVAALVVAPPLNYSVVIR